MRGAVVLVLAVAACRPPPPERLSREPEIEHEEPRAIELAAPVLLPRPDIDLSNLVPDPTHELRWPLSMSSHPALEPQFEIAAALAAQNRHLGRDKRDHVAYLRAWWRSATERSTRCLARSSIGTRSSVSRHDSDHREQTNQTVPRAALGQRTRGTTTVVPNEVARDVMRQSRTDLLPAKVKYCLDESGHVFAVRIETSSGVWAYDTQLEAPS